MIRSFIGKNSTILLVPDYQQFINPFVIFAGYCCRNCKMYLTYIPMLYPYSVAAELGSFSVCLKKYVAHITGQHLPCS